MITVEKLEKGTYFDDNVWHSVEEMEAEKSEQFQEENAEADPEK